MKPIFLSLIFLFNLLRADDFQVAVATDGTIWSIYIEVEEGESASPFIKIEVEDNEGDVFEKLFIPSEGTQVSSPNIACNSQGYALAAWIEKNSTSSRCVASYFDGKKWQKKKIISSKKLLVDPLTRPAISLESEHDATVAYCAEDSKKTAYLLIHHYDNNQWSEEELVTVSSHPLQFPSLSLDPFGNNYIAWIDPTEERVKIAQELDLLWDVCFEAEAAALLPPIMSTSDSDLVCAWLTTETTIQSARYENDWILLDPIEVEEKVSYMVLSYANPLGYFLFWMTGNEKEEPTALEMAILEGLTWENIETPDFEDDEFDP